MSELEAKIVRGADLVRSRRGDGEFDLAVILGSGLGAFSETIVDPVIFPYSCFDFLPGMTVAGHAGCLVAGNLGKGKVLVFQGRFHLYEGHEASTAVLPVRFAREMGCKKLLLTNAAGGVNEGYRPGDFMFIDDHLNLMGQNPLRGVRQNPFVDLTRLYERGLYAPLIERLRSWEGRLHAGVLAALAGPSYETPAEIRMLRNLGADAVSMSTVPEAIMGKYLGMDVAGISMITNLAAGMSAAVLAHDDVLETSRKRSAEFSSLLLALIDLWFSADRAV